MLHSVYVKDVMTQNVFSVNTDAKVIEAVKMMAQQNIGSVVARETERPVGIVTERDLLSKVLAFGHKLDSLQIGDVMVRSIIKITPDKSLREACKAMIAQKNRLLVFENDRLVGIATATDLSRGVTQAGSLTMKVKQMMTRRVFMVEDKYSAGEAVRVMNDKRIGSVLVTSDGKPYGIFTERDLLTKILAKDENLAVDLPKVLSTPIVKATPETELKDAAKLMDEKKIKRLPIFESEEPVGIVTARDVVEAYAVYGS
jgi:predicted transcriptional regulator